MFARSAVLTFTLTDSMQSITRQASRPAMRRIATAPPRSVTRTKRAAAAAAPRFLTPTRVQARLLSDKTRAAIDEAVGSAPVVLFMKGTPETPQCGFSRAAIQILGAQGVDPGKFAAFNVLEDQELREGIKEYSDWPTIPQLYIAREFVGGCDILVSMHKNGDLAKLLDEKKLIVEVKE